MALLEEIDPTDAAALTGSFTHPTLGAIAVTVEDNGLVLDAGELRSRLGRSGAMPDQPARYILLDPPLSGTPVVVTFEPGPDGRPRPVFTAAGEAGDPPLVYEFTRVMG